MSTKTTLTINGRAPTCGTFSKGTTGAVAINFGYSASPYCADSRVWKDNGCYAQRVEARPDRKGLAAKLLRHQRTRADWILSRGLTELESKTTPPPWIRLCTNGALPPDPGRAMARQFVRLGDYICDNDLTDRHHIPAETARKAEQYRAIDPRLTIRESTQTRARWLVARGPSSFVAGTKDMTLMERITSARLAAKDRRDATGRPTGVCPAVMQSFRQRTWQNRRAGSIRRGVDWTAPKPPSAKCGQCRLCALPEYDVVYPWHG